ncbi:MAG TPA: gliding motility-associated C-terminal domain-containing protein [Bacteroidia bacterium]|nr:gliding motility-associated C-terminal domain-containing protein [Bacteroidia bacterium]
MKYSPNGDLLWAKAIAGKYEERINKVKVDRLGNVYVTGLVGDSCYFTPSYLIRTRGSLSRKAFVAKYDANGTFKWVVLMGNDSSTGNSQGRAIGIDSLGYVYCAGSYNYSSSAFESLNLTNGDGYLAKLDSNGNFIWVLNSKNIYIPSISVGNDNCIYLTGTTSSLTPCFLGNKSITNLKGSSDLFLGKVHNTGFISWIKIHGTAQNDNGFDLSLSKNGLIYLAGKISTGFYLDSILLTSYGVNTGLFACFDTTGKCLWAHTAGLISGSSGALSLLGVKTFDGNTVVFAGSIQTPGGAMIKVGSNYHISNGIADLIIVKMDGLGNFLYSFTSGGANSEQVNAVSLDQYDNAYVAGTYQNGINFKQLSATGFGGNDLFLTKISDIGISRTPLSKTVYCAGDSMYVPYTRYNSFHAANTFYAQLSDTAGNFTNPVTIGSKPSNQNGTISCKLPSGLLYSSKYQLRVVSDSPVVQSYYLNQTYTIYPRPVATANNITLCSGQADTLTAINLKNNTAQWSPATYLTNINDNSTLFTAPSNTTNTNQVAFVQLLVSNAGGCKDSTTLSVTIRPQLLVTTNSDTTLCTGQSPTITLHTTATGGDSSNYRYLWKDAAGNILSSLSAQDTLQVATDSTRTYTVYLTDGCTMLPDTANSAQVTITIRPPLQLSIVPDTIVCKGSPVTLTAQPSGGKGVGYYSIQWFILPDTTSVQHTGNTYTVTVNNNQQYQANLTDGCTALPFWSNSITVNTYNKIQLTPRADTTINKGQSVNLTAQATGGRGSAYTFTWYKLPDSTTAIGITNPLTALPVQPDSTTTYRVIATDGCAANTDTAHVVITVRQQLEISILSADNDTTICNGQSVTYTLLANYPSAGQQFTWNNGLGTGSTKTLSPITNTTYLVILSDNQSTPDTVYITVNVRAPLQLHNLHDTTICEGQSVTFNPFATGGLASNYQFLWNDNSNTSSKTFSITTTAINATLTVSDNCSSPQSKSITITPELNPKVSLTATPTQGCPPLNTTITNTQNNSGTYTQDWDFADGSNTQTTTTNNNNNSINHSYTLTGNYPPILSLTSSRGCKSTATLSPPINLFEKPEAKFTLSRDTTWITLPQIQLTNQSSKADSFFWSFSRLINDTITTKTSNTTFHRNFTDSGIYTISLTAKNSACADSTQQKLVVLMDYDVWIPNAFSPGTKDNLNPTFAPVGVGISRYKMIIYNRWGQIVFESKGTQDSWNGCLDNNPEKPLPEGVYVWYIEIFNYHNSGNIKGGMVHLIR